MIVTSLYQVISSGSVLSPVQRQAIVWTASNILQIGTSGKPLLNI